MDREEGSNTEVQVTAFKIEGTCNINTSSWRDHLYDQLFYGIVLGLRPEICVELGTLSGYSAYCMATALKDLGYGTLDCYDLWESYPYNHVPMSEARRNLKGLPVNLHKEDCGLVYAHYLTGTVDLLFVDISNDGYVYEKILSDWYEKLSDKAIVIMEGGANSRDKVGWMKDYKKIPIRKALSSRFITQHYDYVVWDYFPGITILRKKKGVNG